jgi:excisionase family DNA binding protein
MTTQTWLTLAEAADALKVGVPTVRELIERGELQATQHNGELCVPEQALIAFLQASQRALENDGQPSEVQE